jgi:hypothetical protein
LEALLSEVSDQEAVFQAREYTPIFIELYSTACRAGRRDTIPEAIRHLFSAEGDLGQNYSSVHQWIGENIYRTAKAGHFVAFPEDFRNPSEKSSGGCFGAFVALAASGAVILYSIGQALAG